MCRASPRVAVAMLLRISSLPADIDESGKELIDFIVGCCPEHLVPDATAVEAPPELMPSCPHR